MYGLDIERDSWVLALAAHLYYHTGEQSPLSDESYDALKDIIRVNWDLVPKVLKKRFISPDDIRYSACHVKLTEEELVYARSCLR